ncbi:hypothetical protein GAY29_01170 [Azospirillum brasilense]|nr:hypothetical protein [Azospirillum brasilense]
MWTASLTRSAASRWKPIWRPTRRRPPASCTTCGCATRSVCPSPARPSRRRSRRWPRPNRPPPRPRPSRRSAPGRRCHGASNGAPCGVARRRS